LECIFEKNTETEQGPIRGPLVFHSFGAAMENKAELSAARRDVEALSLDEDN
jgi:hypothetical protein